MDQFFMITCFEIEVRLFNQTFIDDRVHPVLIRGLMEPLIRGVMEPVESGIIVVLDG